MNPNVQSYRDEQAEAWDKVVAGSVNGTFLHSRRFLSYHGARFSDVSCCIFNGANLVGVFPAAVDPEATGIVTSHPGITYGGLVHDGSLVGLDCLRVMEALIAHYAASGFHTLRYKAVPRNYHRMPAEDDLYGLFRLGARRYRVDLCAAIALAARATPSARRRRALRKALKSQVEVSECNDLAAEFWAMLESNLADRHSARPTHSLEEILLLNRRFPDRIRFVVGMESGVPAAGVVLFETETTTHTQYIASTEQGREISALDVVIEHCIDRALARGATYFSFGTSNEDGGRILNDGLYRFKTEFGAAGIVHEYYELEM